MKYRSKRDILSQNSPKFENKNYKVHFENAETDNLVVPPVLPEKFKHIFHGGERYLNLSFS